MISRILKKYTDVAYKRKMLVTMIWALSLWDEQKKLYFDAIKKADIPTLDQLYKNVIDFSQNIEIKEIDDIRKSNFSKISGMTKKEAEEKKKDINAFSFLLHNL